MHSSEEGIGMPGKMTNREFYHGTPERDAKTKVRGYVGMNNVRLVTIEYDGEYVDTVKERYYGVWLDLPCEREEAYWPHDEEAIPYRPLPFLTSSTTSAGANSSHISTPRADAIGYVPNDELDTIARGVYVSLPKELHCMSNPIHDGIRKRLNESRSG